MDKDPNEKEEENNFMEPRKNSMESNQDLEVHIGMGYGIEKLKKRMLSQKIIPVKEFKLKTKEEQQKELERNKI